MKRLLEEDFPDAKKVILVCDNLNTHTLGAFYEAFGDCSYSEAWQLAECGGERFKFVDGAMRCSLSFWYDRRVTSGGGVVVGGVQ